MSGLDEISRGKSLDLPESRKLLRAEIKKAKPYSMELTARQKTSFGDVVMKRRRGGQYRLILLEREDTPDELYFFYPLSQ